MKHNLSIFVASLLCLCGSLSAADKRPGILWITIEDWSERKEGQPFFAPNRPGVELFDLQQVRLASLVSDAHSRTMGKSPFDVGAAGIAGTEGKCPASIDQSQQEKEGESQEVVRLTR